MRIPLATHAALLLVATLAALLALPSPALAVPAEQVRVIDGDTVAIGQERLRLLNIDAPETSSPRCPAEAAAGERATTRLKELTAGGVMVVRSGDRDRYGRTLGRLVVGTRDVGDILLSEGVALPWEPGRRAWEERRRHWCP